MRLDVSSTRSTDVLDTWFSSALWPFATLGWPDDTEDLRTFYPGDMNTTARDIIRLWENRMIFAGLELHGRRPVPDVVIHSTVHAPAGGRMSKSLGTGMNPLAAIETYGADATRYGLLKMASSQDVRFSEGAIEEGRKLANKLWNVARLILQATRRRRAGRAAAARSRSAGSSRGSRRRSARSSASWRVRLRPRRRRALPPHVRRLLRLVRGGDQAAALRAATRRRGRRRSHALERLLTLLHPVMPHVTEEIWSQLPTRDRLIVAPWPGRTRHAATRRALDRVQGAAPVFRRSGVRLELGATTSARIFDAVVRPERGGRRRRRRRSSSGSGRRSRGPRGCSPTSGSSRTRPRTSSRRSARSSRATAASSSCSAADAAWPRGVRMSRGSKRSARGRRGVRARRGCVRCSRELGEPQRRLSGGSRRRDERQVDRRRA